ncbi:MAG: hypothetical protein P4M15_00830 [Alphaproteobacteria bacterium]|nr:hypothetical protein [Alphaproteobacteria bacterium]
MIRPLSRRLALTAAAFSFALCLSAQAQNNTPESAPPQIAGAGEHQDGERGQENLDRQDLREEIEQVRKEHDDVEAARDKLWDECVKSRDKSVDACQQEKMGLDERREKLHVRAVALHEKLEGVRKEMREERREEHGAGEAGGMHQPPAPIPAK